MSAALAAAPAAAWLQALRPALLQACDDAVPPARLQAGVELLCRLEAQLLPAALIQRMGDIARLRELAARLCAQQALVPRALLAATLEGMLRLHFDDLEALFGEPEATEAAEVAPGPPEADTLALLRRWCG